MQNFTYSVPTKIYFGKGQLIHLAELNKSGNSVLLVYGGGSIKKMGLYEEAMAILKDSNLKVYELSGVEPNPRIESVRAGVELCKQNNISMVLAIGGGSVIDCAKVIAAGAVYDSDPWDLVLDSSKIKSALPIYSVLTLSATGSEMDSFAVISDLSKNEKWGTGSEHLKPKMSILNPEYTFSVSKKQTAAGTADIMSHTFENYFNPVNEAFVQASFAESILKTCIKYAPIALQHPDNYEARANLMWSSSLAINGLLSDGCDVGWCVHPMEHELSAFYDITHGEGLAILTPYWMEFALCESTLSKFAAYGRNVWGLNGEDGEVAKKSIECTREFFAFLNLPAHLSEVGINEEHFEIMAEKAANGSKGSFVPLTKEDIIGIFKAAL